MRNVVLRLALPSLLTLGLLALGSAPASAHASLVGTDPDDGSTRATAPSSVTFTFNENVGNAAVAVTAPDGSSVKLSELSAVDNAVTAQVAAVDMKGRYTASYRVVSSDGHPIAGTVAFTVTTGRSVAQVAQPEQDTFLHRHSAHVLWGVLAAAVAIALLLMPLRRRDDPDHT
ncbi:copper resistance CopC family protein [Aeromicrobium sp. A1-2]|uniref:copper resistance CopC family protein n=1 Tax=Aeromicrobium sp. A1-2 TaxID=2107713 RepID=UPI0013C2E6C4|nr:copper resistance CopC family protein [Aeromicrobium sp. A1-2]